jgi:hypothetical protein
VSAKGASDAAAAAADTYQIGTGVGNLKRFGNHGKIVKKI